MQHLWSEFLKIIKEEAGSQVVETWFKAVTLDRWDPATSTCTLRMPNSFVRRWIEEHYLDLISRHIGRLLNAQNVRVFCLSSTQEHTPAPNIVPASSLQNNFMPTLFPTKKPLVQSNVAQKTKLQVLGLAAKRQELYGKLNENYTFDNFIVGPSNSLAHAAAIAVSQHLASKYNPLFIYGGTGLGKTHLLHAIGNACKKKNPQLLVAYISSDHFMNEFISSIRLEKVQKFREKFQQVDVLLLDDIQFFSKKEQTQEIFFHIFNALYEQKKQIVFSSDAMPEDIERLQERLRSRLKSGLIADVQLPSLEMKMAILNKKALSQNIELSAEVATFLASQPVDSIRELEGLLIRISASSSLMNAPITLELAKQVMSASNERAREDITHEAIMKIVSSQFAVTIDEVRSEKRTKNVALARQVIIYLMKKMTMSSLCAIGSSVGGRDHSTVLHAIGKIEELKGKDVSLASQLKTLEQAILRQR